MEATRARADELSAAIVGRLMRRHGTATVLFHPALAERLGLGPTDHKCLDVIRERGAMTSSELGAATGLTSGAVAVVVARLERAGYLHRTPDAHDRRKQILSPAPDRAVEVHAAIAPIRHDVAALLTRFDDSQLDAIAAFLEGTSDLLHRNAVLLRAGPAFASARGEAVVPTREQEPTRG